MAEQKRIIKKRRIALLVCFTLGVTIINCCSRIDLMVRLSCLDLKDSTIISFGETPLLRWDTLYVIQGISNPERLDSIVGGSLHTDSFVQQVIVFKKNNKIIYAKDWYFGYEKYYRPIYFLTRKEVIVKDRASANFVCFPTKFAYVLIDTDEYDQDMRNWLIANKEYNWLRKFF